MAIQLAMWICQLFCEKLSKNGDIKKCNHMCNCTQSPALFQPPFTMGYFDFKMCKKNRPFLHTLWRAPI